MIVHPGHLKDKIILRYSFTVTPIPMYGPGLFGAFIQESRKFRGNGASVAWVVNFNNGNCNNNNFNNNNYVRAVR